jgi:hypothetical protein
MCERGRHLFLVEQEADKHQYVDDQQVARHSRDVVKKSHV